MELWTIKGSDIMGLVKHPDDGDGLVTVYPVHRWHHLRGSNAPVVDGKAVEGCSFTILSENLEKNIQDLQVEIPEDTGGIEDVIFDALVQLQDGVAERVFEGDELEW